MDKMSINQPQRVAFHPVVLILFVGTALSRIATSMTTPFLTIFLSQHTSMGPWEIGMTVGASALAGMGFGFFGGTLSDQWGRKGIMIISLYIWAMTFFGFAWNTWVGVYLLLSLLMGVCRSAFEPVSTALISDLTPKELRYRAYSIRYTAANAGFAIGPLIGAYAGIVGGATAFMWTGAFYLAYAAILQLILRRYPVGQAEQDSSRRITVAVAWKAARQDKALLLFLIGGVFMQFVYSQFSTLGPYAQDHFENGVVLFSWMMTANALTVVVFQMPLSILTEKRSPLTLVRIGNILYAIGGFGFALSQEPWHMVASMVVFSIGEILCFPAGNALTDEIAPNHLKGAYFGAQNFRELGRFLGPTLGLPILASYGILPLFTLVAIIALISTYFYSWGGRVNQQRISMEEVKVTRGYYKLRS
jgi:MFS family permease